MLTAELSESLVELKSLSANPVDFAARRREIILRFMKDQEPNRVEHLIAFQSEIEDSCALAGSPSRAMATLLGMMDDRAAALKELGDAYGEKNIGRPVE